MIEGRHTFAPLVVVFVSLSPPQGLACSLSSFRSVSGRHKPCCPRDFEWLNTYLGCWWWHDDAIAAALCSLPPDHTARQSTELPPSRNQTVTFFSGLACQLHIISYILCLSAVRSLKPTHVLGMHAHTFREEKSLPHPQPLVPCPLLTSHPTHPRKEHAPAAALPHPVFHPSSCGTYSVQLAGLAHVVTCV